MKARLSAEWGKRCAERGRLVRPVLSTWTQSRNAGFSRQQLNNYTRAGSPCHPPTRCDVAVHGSKSLVARDAIRSANKATTPKIQGRKCAIQACTRLNKAAQA